MQTNDEIHPVEVFAGTIMECEMVKSLLENAEIQCYLNNEYNGVMVPWITSAGGVNAVKIVVSSEDIDNARIVVDEYKKNVRD